MHYYTAIPKLSWRAREVVREIDRKPHLLTCLEIEGMYFPQRAAPAFARILVPKREPILCWFATISDDGRTLHAYFPVDLPRRGTIEIGYGNRVIAKLPVGFDPKVVGKLDATRLPRDVVRPSLEELKARR